MHPIDVSVVIVNWNTVDLLRQCLDSVYRETHGVSFEVIVVDNASSDGSVEMTLGDFSDAVMIANSENLGFAAANNQGLARASGRYALLLNSDTIVLDGAIQKTVAFADRHEEAAVVGCRVLNPDGSLQNSCFMFPSVLNWLLLATGFNRICPRNHFFGREQMTWWSRDDVREVDVVTGCYMLVRRQAIEDVGAMDAGFFMYAEETDWCYRFKRRGWKSLFTPDARIIHIGGGSAPKLSARRARIANASFLRYMNKHWSKPRAFVGRAMIALFYAVRLAALAPKRLLGASERDARLLENHWTGFKHILTYDGGRSHFEP